MSRYQDSWIEENNYVNDPRVRALEERIEGFDEDTMTITFVEEECFCSECEAKMPRFVGSGVLWDFRRDNHWPDEAYGCVGVGAIPLEREAAEALDALDLWPFVRDGHLLTPTAASAERLARRLNEAGGFATDYPPPHVWVLRASYDVCPTCNGKGKHVNPSIDCNGIGSDDEFWDDDYDEETGQSRYMSGFYDVPCYQCQGKRVAPYPVDDESRGYKRWLECERDRAEYAAERAAERRMGC